MRSAAGAGTPGPGRDIPGRNCPGAQLDQPIAAFDLQRMIFGDGSPLFLLEIVLRTLIVYVYALLLLRWLGSRTIERSRPSSSCW